MNVSPGFLLHWGAVGTNVAAAILYVRWGIAHVRVGLEPLRTLETDGAEAFLQHIAWVPSHPISTDIGQMGIGLLQQHHFNILFAGLFAIVVAITAIWRGSVIGWITNLLVIGAIDYAFVVSIVERFDMPLPAPVWDYVWAAVLSTVGTGVLLVRRWLSRDAAHGSVHDWLKLCLGQWRRKL